LQSILSSKQFAHYYIKSNGWGTNVEAQVIMLIIEAEKKKFNSASRQTDEKGIKMQK
jgi:hypothetical protein